MLEFFLSFEKTAPQFSPIILMGIGILCLLAGLFIWLGGLGLRKILVAVIGIIAGSLCGFFLDKKIILTAIFATVAAVIAIAFERIFIILLLAALVTASALLVLSAPYFQQDTKSIFEHTRQEHLSINESIVILKVFVADFDTKLKDASLQMPFYNWIIISALALTSLVGAFFLRRLTTALCCATLGTILIFAAMLSLLEYKNSEPISHIAQKQLFYLAVLTVMIAFGTIEQLLLCKYKTRQLKKKQQEEKSQESTKKTANWRGT